MPLEPRIIDVDPHDRHTAEIAGLALYLADAVGRGELGWEVALGGIREIVGGNPRRAADAISLVVDSGDSGALASELLVRAGYADVA